MHADALRDRAEVLTILGRDAEAINELRYAITLYERKNADGLAAATQSLVEGLTPARLG